MEQVRSPLLRRLTATSTLVALLCGVAGCTGESGSPSPGTGSNSGASSSTGVGSNFGGSGANTGGANGVTPADVKAPEAPGALVLRRLNRTEYNNTVADLLGTKLRPGDEFPNDDLGGEFDTVGAALSLSPAYVMAYEKAAHDLVDDLFADSTRKAQLVTCNVDTAGDACATAILTSFARKAWRRPATADEVNGLLATITIAKSVNETATEGLKNALAAVLLSPFFIFKLELDPDPAATAPRQLNGHELATRLSYALWSSMPDDALAADADAGKLGTDREVAAQVDRMLGDPRSKALLDTFAAEWMSSKELEGHIVEPEDFPKFTPALAKSMKGEVSKFFDEFLRSQRPLAELLSARFTYVDDALAAHYGIARPGGAGADFVKVDTTNSPRAGLLTMGALLTTTSYPNRSSPVRRGEFVIRRLLCADVPPPPPNVPALEDAAAADGLTLRQRTELHRKDPACSACHNLMDPIGFGLESYDAIGTYRTTDGATPIDASGQLLDGTPFTGGVELANVLAKDARFPACVTNKFMTFSIGRLLSQAPDEQWVQHISGLAMRGDGSLPSVIRAVLMSQAFRSRQPRAL